MELTLYIPALFGPRGRFSADFLPVLPALETLLGRARHRRLTPATHHGRMAALIGYDLPADTDVPVAAVTRLLDTGGPRGGTWMRADPVHLAADHRGLVLVDGERAGIDQREALVLAAAIRPLLQDSGLDIEVPHPLRWYLRMDERDPLRTVELPDAAGGDVRAALPSGPGASRWLRLLNEIQICMHGCEVNREREGRGLPSMNSVWFWGCGTEPRPPRDNWSTVLGDDVFLRAAAQQGGQSWAAVPALAEEFLHDRGAERVLVVHGACQEAARYQDLQGWLAALDTLERDWFGPLLAALGTGDLRSVELVTGDRAARTTRLSLHARWRRRRPLGHYVTEQQGS